MQPIFQEYDPDNVDPIYRALHDAAAGDALRAREFIEKLWSVYETYKDPGFLREIQLHFHERFWEMYLTCSLLEFGLNVLPYDNSEGGPDVFVEEGDSAIWFEATCPGPGAPNKPDSVPGFFECDGEVPIDAIVLRVRGAIDEKRHKYRGYRKKDIVRVDDAYVIAVNTWGAFQSGLPGVEPSPVERAVYGVGSQKIIFDSSNFEPVELTYEEKDRVVKSSGAPVMTDIFTDGRHNHVSAILWSSANAGRFLEPLGADFRLSRNPFATNGLAEGIL